VRRGRGGGDRLQGAVAGEHNQVVDEGPGDEGRRPGGLIVAEVLIDAGRGDGGAEHGEGGLLGGAQLGVVGVEQFRAGGVEQCRPAARGWQREVERHTAIKERLAQLLDQLGASAAG